MQKETNIRSYKLLDMPITEGLKNFSFSKLVYRSSMNIINNKD